jgi:signal transduction histidine kinase
MINSPFKILAVDDKTENLIIIKALIKETFPQARVITTQTGLEGIEMARTYTPDIVLLDVVMPEMDGFEVCKILKSDPETNDIPVVFVTAMKEDTESRIRGLEVGAEAFLAKPIESSELIAQIRAMLKVRFANLIKRDENKKLSELVSDRTRELERNNLATLNLLEDLKRENEARRKTETELIETQEKLKKFAAHLQYVREEERVSLAREIHDELGQILVAIKIELGMLIQKVMNEVDEARRNDCLLRLSRLSGLVNDTINSSRRIMTDLRPAMLDFLGFIEAGRQHVMSFGERNQIECNFVNDLSDLRIDMRQSVALFRILQESLNNIARHAQATEVSIHIGSYEKIMFLEISDNGKGFDMNQMRRMDSYGILGMMERALLLEGVCNIQSIPGGGTRVRVEMPLLEMTDKR